MALRKIRIEGDPILRKKSKTVKEIDDKVKQLIADMKETVVVENGVGLAAVQVGVLKRVIVVWPDEEGEITALINPEIVEESGCQVGQEGCLSIPGRNGNVERPDRIKVKYMDEEGNSIEIIAEDFLARIICHEVDHTNGILYIDKLVEIDEE